MSFLKKLFGGGDKPAANESGDKVLGEESYKGYLIKAISMPVGAEMQLCGTIEKDFAGELKTYRFVRADRVSRDDVAPLAFAKGRQIIDEQGDKLFS